MRTKDESKFGRHESHGQGCLLWLKAFLKYKKKARDKKNDYVCGWNIFKFFHNILKYYYRKLYQGHRKAFKIKKTKTKYFLLVSSKHDATQVCLQNATIRCIDIWRCHVTSRQKFYMPEIQNHFQNKECKNDAHHLTNLNLSSMYLSIRLLISPPNLPI